jgi:MFS family permease
VAFVSLFAFVRCEFAALDPLLDLHLLQQKNFFLTSLAIVLVVVTYVGVIYLFPIYLQLVQGYSPSVAGLIFTSLSVAVMVGGVLGGTLFNRAGGRRVNIASGVLVLAGYILLTAIRPDSPVWFMVLCMVLIGFGFGMLLTSASTMAMMAVPKKNQGMVSGFICLARFVPITIGVALFTIVFVGGMNAASPGSGVASEALVNINTNILSAGFGQAFLFGCISSLLLLAVVIMARQEVHPDYLDKGDDGSFSPVMCENGERNNGPG